MPKIKMLLLAMALPAALFAATTEISMPMKMDDIAARFQKNCPENVKFSAQQDTLVITLDATKGKGSFDGVHAVSLKPLAGRVVTFIFDVKVDKAESSDGTNIHSVGRISVGGNAQHLLVRNTGWHTYVFKSVKIPGNGLLKMRFSFKNVSGEVQIRNPRIKGDLPKVPKKKTKSKKNKKD